MDLDGAGASQNAGRLVAGVTGRLHAHAAVMETEPSSLGVVAGGVVAGGGRRRQRERSAPR